MMRPPGMRPMGPRMGQPGPQGPPRMGPPRPQGPPRMGQPGPRMGQSGPQGPRMGQGGPQGPRMGQGGPPGHRMGQPGPQGPRMGQPGPQGPRMGPPGGQGSRSLSTNTNDPNSVRARVFVGNLNTFALSQEEVEQIFMKYGLVMGISMHKGYAFVQYEREAEARIAAGAEDGKTYAGQVIATNIASEPKGRGIKRQSSNSGQSDWSSNSQQGSTPSPVNTSMKRTLVTLSGDTSGPPKKKPMTSPTVSSSSIKTVQNKVSSVLTKTSSLSTSVKTSAPKPASSSVQTVPVDVLICGRCKLQFTSLHSLAQHKKIPCKLRFSCQCQNNPPPAVSDEPTQLQCATCDAQFNSAWSLVQHCQAEHDVKVYKTDEPKTSEENGDDNTLKKSATKTSPEDGKK